MVGVVIVVTVGVGVGVGGAEIYTPHPLAHRASYPPPLLFVSMAV